MTARELGRPEREWFTFEDDTDARGRPVKRRVERRIGTREVSLLTDAPGVTRLDLPQLQAATRARSRSSASRCREPGYHVVEIESLRLGQALLDKRAPMFVRTGVLVTNLGVHFKLGRENSLVWVTTLDRGRPVEGADVAVSDCRGEPLWTGRTDARGLAIVSRALDASFDVRAPADSGYFVTARKFDDQGAARDIAFVFSNWQKGIEPWRFNVPTGRGAEPDLRAATVFDRTLLRAGETVSMKHFIRVETLRGLAAVPPRRLPNAAADRAPRQRPGVRAAAAMARRRRSAESTWNIPPAARLGVYDVVLERAEQAAPRSAPAGEGDDEDRRPRRWTSGNFRVEEFRVAAGGCAHQPARRRRRSRRRRCRSRCRSNYFSGGAMASGAGCARRRLLKARAPAFPGYDDFSFEPPRDPNAGRRGATKASTARARRPARRRQGRARDRSATAPRRCTLKDLPKIERPSELTAEVSFNDPNGEVQTASTRIAAVAERGRRRRQGRRRGRATAARCSSARSRSTPAASRSRASASTCARRLSQTITHAQAHRRRLLRLRQPHRGAGPRRALQRPTDGHGLLACDAALETAGQVELIAHGSRRAGPPGRPRRRASGSRGQGELWFAQDNDDRIDVLPEKKRYEPGETARLQVRMPFREATALVAIEREGVIETQRRHPARRRSDRRR